MPPDHPKPIETHYAGHRFRSRLKACWAVFFDRLGIQWHYEEQGYELPSGRYLPDFRLERAASLGQSDLWVEVKGAFTHHGFVRVLRAAVELPRFSNEPLRPTLLVLGDVPEPGEPWVHTRLDTLGDHLLMQQVQFWTWYRGRDRGFATRASHDPVAWHKDLLNRLHESGNESTRKIRDGWLEPAIDYRLRVHPTVDDAYRAARAAWFEFGEHG